MSVHRAEWQNLVFCMEVANAVDPSQAEKMRLAAIGMEG